MSKVISGNYYTDECGFINVVTDDEFYTIAGKTGKWGCVHVGERFAHGGLLTVEWLNEARARCDRYGDFVLKEGAE